MFHHIKFIVFILFVTVALIMIYTIFSKWIKHRERGWAFQLKSDNNKAMSPLRISAIERLIIMLERIAPTALVMRQNIASSNAAMLQLELIKSIREEFEHNVSLQMYVTEATWTKVKRAKEETTELIKVAFTKVRPEAAASDLGREIFKLEAAVGNSAIKEAIASVKMEIVKNY